MFRLKSIFKSIIKYPTSTALNIISLIIAFSGIITLVLYVSYENSFDTYNENYDQIYKVQVGKDGSTVPAVMSPIISKNVSEIESITPLWFSYSLATTSELADKSTNYHVSVLYAENDVFDIFTFPFILGDKGVALTNHNSIVLTQKLSSKLFGDDSPIGKNVILRNETFICTGVIENLPETSSISTDCLVSFKNLTQNANDPPNTWQEWSYRIFCKLSKGADYEDVFRKVNSIDDINKHLKNSRNETEIGSYVQLRPMKEVHFANDNIFKPVNRKVLMIFSLLAVILAIMGAVNFINLSTSHAFQKAKVFSIIRILGGTRNIVMAQVIVESVLISLFALAVSFLLHGLVYPLLENTLQIDGLGLENRGIWYLYFVLMAVGYGIVAGFYPARYITSSNLSQSVKGSNQFSGKGKFIRNSLVVMQFVFTIALIISSITIEKQINFWHNFDIGIQKENVICINTTSSIREHNDAFTKEVMNNPNITQYTYSNFAPGGVGMGWGRVIDGQSISLMCWPIDQYFFDFFNVEIVDGRAFSKNMAADKNKFILNQKAVKEFEWDKPLEKVMSGFGFNGEIIGVAKDFNFSSLKDDVQPMQFWLTDSRKSVLMLKITSGNYPNAIAHIKNTWEQFEHNADFNYKFLDDSLNTLYQKEERIAYFIEFVALWCILLSITGLLGLVIFTSRNRTKEIGIRKVNGATVFQIMQMLNKDFVKWVVLAFVIATPAAYYAMSIWLQNFTYKTQISWWVFALAGIIVLVISVITVSWQTFKAARKNPVEALRYE